MRDVYVAGGHGSDVLRRLEGAGYRAADEAEFVRVRSKVEEFLTECNQVLTSVDLCGGYVDQIQEWLLNGRKGDPPGLPSLTKKGKLKTPSVDLANAGQWGGNYPDSLRVMEFGSPNAMTGTRQGSIYPAKTKKGQATRTKGPVPGDSKSAGVLRHGIFDWNEAEMREAYSGLLARVKGEAGAAQKSVVILDDQRTTLLRTYVVKDSSGKMSYFARSADCRPVPNACVPMEALIPKDPSIGATFYPGSF